MSFWFAVFAGLTIAGSWSALALRNLVHCALALAVAFAGVATLYIFLGAQFLGLAQLLVYVGAVAVLIVFVTLLTRGAEDVTAQGVSNAVAGICVAAAMFGILAFATLRSRVLSITSDSHAAIVPVRELGTELMTAYIFPLEVVALMLTAALIGAVIVSMKEKRDPR
jgi:NADH-quinone oxidoreductase subunit J